MVIDFKKKERYTEIKNKRAITVLLIVSLKEFNYYAKAVDICTLHKILFTFASTSESCFCTISFSCYSLIFQGKIEKDMNNLKLMSEISLNSKWIGNEEMKCFKQIKIKFQTHFNFENLFDDF